MTTSTTSRDLGPGRAARTAGVAAVTAVVVNLVIFGIGTALDVDFVVIPPGDERVTVALPVVAVMTLVPLLVGGVLLAVAGRRVGVWNVLAWIGLAVGLLSAVGPLDSAVQTSTGVTLALMHVVTGLAWFLAVRREAGTP